MIEKETWNNNHDEKLKVGHTTTSGFTLTQRINSIDEFWYVINHDKSIFARHRMYSSAFFFSWQIKLIVSWIDRGWFYRATKNDVIQNEHYL